MYLASEFIAVGSDLGLGDWEGGRNGAVTQLDYVFEAFGFLNL